MARLIKHERNKPYTIKEGDVEFPIHICACGLSQNKPYCDGSHKKTRDENEDALYAYEGDERVEFKNMY